VSKHHPVATSLRKHKPIALNTLSAAQRVEKLPNGVDRYWQLNPLTLAIANVINSWWGV
jgi:hypothetical protein